MLIVDDAVDAGHEVRLVGIDDRTIGSVDNHRYNLHVAGGEDALGKVECVRIGVFLTGNELCGDTVFDALIVVVDGTTYVVEYEVFNS